MKELTVISKSKSLAVMAYKLYDSMQNQEKYTIGNQIYRSAISVPSNIAEGSQRGSDKEFIRFINIARGSLTELKVQLEILKECRFPNVDVYDKEFKDEGKKHEITLMLELIDEIGKMTYGLILKLKAGGSK